MKKSQNLREQKKRGREESGFCSPVSVGTWGESQREKSIPKFNRKTQIKQFSRKKSESNLGIQQPICYISPKRNSQQPNSFFRSPTFEDVAHNFSATLPQFPTMRSTEPAQSQKLSQSRRQSLNSTSRDRIFDEEGENYRLEIASLRLEIERTEKENKKMREKIKELGGLQAFLVEREAFIYELTDKNLQLNQEVSQNQRHQQGLEGLVKQLRSQLQIEKHSWEQKYGTLLRQSKNQQSQIEVLLKKNLQFKEELKGRKRSKSSQKKPASKKSKENNEHFNRKRRNFQKNKSLFISPPTSPKESQRSEVQVSQIDCNSSVGGDNKTLAQLCKNMSGMVDSCTSSMFSSQVSCMEGMQTFPMDFDAERVHFQESIKKLRQKLRYSEIEVDILKKMKMEKNKTKEENDLLKIKNRKLLHRIDFISRQTRKRRSDSNSSLELSLSPKKC